MLLCGIFNFAPKKLQTWEHNRQSNWDQVNKNSYWLSDRLSSKKNQKNSQTFFQNASWILFFWTGYVQRGQSGRVGRSSCSGAIQCQGMTVDFLCTQRIILVSLCLCIIESINLSIHPQVDLNVGLDIWVHMLANVW